MTRDEKARICDEADVFLAARKHLDGPQPVWRQNGQLDRLDASWPIHEESGISRAYLAFRVNRISSGAPSVSLIFRQKPLCRVDIMLPDEEDVNPLQAGALGLPGVVRGTHIHRWRNNRDYVLDVLPPDEWEIPIKDEVSRATQTLSHAVAMICNECEIDFTPEQREVTVPARERLL
ncbi:MAG: hypothetical protein H3C51_07795 [Rubellimicrobium sp.]|nr:hypothetical protein [Rubellimicrobium sp.]